MINLNSIQLALLQQLGIKPLQAKQAFFDFPRMVEPSADKQLSAEFHADLEACLMLTSLDGYSITSQPDEFSVQQHQLLLGYQLQYTAKQKRALWQLLGEYVND